ncbi:hypothetical protein RCCS2_04459 [Roseobacter sp. CCS2]|nr:hypothetical protein RCCS2_04459 [Roseobacter sp. CCS2]
MTGLFQDENLKTLAFPVAKSP